MTDWKERRRRLDLTTAAGRAAARAPQPFVRTATMTTRDPVLATGLRARNTRLLRGEPAQA